MYGGVQMYIGLLGLELVAFKKWTENPASFKNQGFALFEGLLKGFNCLQIPFKVWILPCILPVYIGVD